MFVACDAKWVSIKRVSTQHIAFLWNDYQNFFWGFVSAFCPFQVFLILPGTYVLSIFASCWMKCHCVKMLQIVRYLASWRIFNKRNAINEQTWRNMWRHRSFCASGCPAILLMKPARLLRWSWWFIHEKN